MSSNVISFAAAPDFKPILRTSRESRIKRGQRAVKAIGMATPYALELLALGGEELFDRVMAMRMAVDDGPGQLLDLLTTAEAEAEMLASFIGAARERLQAAAIRAPS